MYGIQHPIIEGVGLVLGPIEPAVAISEAENLDIGELESSRLLD